MNIQWPSDILLYSIDFIGQQYIFIVLNYKELPITIAMLTEDKIAELFCMADDFCKFFDTMMEKYMLKSDKKRHYHRDSTMSKAEIMLIVHCSMTGSTVV